MSYVARLLAVLTVSGIGNGCALNSPKIQLAHAMLGEDRLFVEVECYTEVLESHAVRRDVDSHRYLLIYELKHPHQPILKESFEVSGENQLQCTYSTDRVLRVSGHEYGSAPIRAELVARGATGTWHVLRKWEWQRAGSTPPMAVDNSGRYLVSLGGADAALMDTAALRSISQPDIERMLSLAAALNPGNLAVYTLTQRLGYLIVRLADEDRRGTNMFMASDSRMYLRGPDRPSGPSFYYAVIHKDGSVAAIPDRIPPGQWSGTRSVYVSAGESSSGEFLALYSEYPSSGGERRYTMRGADLAVRDQIAVPQTGIPAGESYGPDVSWDALTNRILFYDHIDLAQSGKAKMYIWDGTNGSLQATSLDLGSEFHQRGGEYVPKSID